MPNKKNRPTDPSVDLPRSRLPIEPVAEQNPPEQEMDTRNSRRFSADLPYGVPTDDEHFTGTPQTDIASGFEEVRPGQEAAIDQALGNRQAEQRFRGTAASKEAQPSSGPQGGNMANLNLRSTEDQEDDRPRGDKSNYDPEQEIPDPEEVERDIERAEEEYGDEDQETGRKIA